MSALTEILKLAEVDISGISPDTILAAQPQPAPDPGLEKALSLVDKAGEMKKKLATMFDSPANSLKASRQVGTSKTTPSTAKSGMKVPRFGTPVVKEPSMSTPKLKLGGLGEEELQRTRRIVMTRADTRAAADEMFDGAKETRAVERSKMKKLFVQAPVATTMAPVLQKEASITPSLDAFFDKYASDETLDDAQRNFPELLSVRK
jgi:hypothetical protein